MCVCMLDSMCVSVELLSLYKEGSGCIAMNTRRENYVRMLQSIFI